MAPLRDVDETPAVCPAVVRRASPEDWPALLAFYRRCHPQRTRLHDGATWAWAFAAREAGTTSFFVLARESGEIVGGIGVRPFSLQFVGGELRAGLLVNYFVDDAYRGMPALRLLRAALADSSVLVGAYVSDSAHRLLTRAGFVDLGAAVRGYHLGLVPGGGIGSAARWLARGVARAAVATRARLAEPRLRYTVAQRLDASLDDRFAAPRGALGVRKDASYLRWRYEAAPELSPLFVHQYAGSQLRGLAVLHIVGPRCVLLDLLDCGASDPSRADLVRASLAAAAARGCTTVETQCAGEAFEAPLRACLFGRSRGDLGLLVYSREAGEREALVDAARWHFVTGDSDAF